VSDLALTVRRAVMATCAVLLVCLVLVTAETAVGIGIGWRLVLNQGPASYTVFRVLRWSGAF
jgi:hypothetical protein